MIRQAPVLTAAVAMLLASVGRPLLAADSKTADVERRANELVRQLGDAAYTHREQASKELIKLGSPAQDALKAALKDPDAEVRFRAAEALAIIKDADFQARLEAFAADVDGKRNLQLPAWDLFRKAIGQDQVARGLFVDMQRAESGLLEALDGGDNKITGEVLVSRCRAIAQMQQAGNARTRGQLAMSSVAAIVFVAAAEDVPIEDQIGIQLNNFIYQSGYQTAARSGSLSAPLKKLLSHWIAKDTGATVGYYNLMLAFSFELPEGLETALRILSNEGPQPHIRQYAILAVGRFGNKQHVSAIEPSLKDATNCFTQQVNNRQVQTQIRDVALAVLVHLTGQDLKAYGYEKAQLHQQMVFNPATLGFQDAAARDAALKKWSEWSAAQARSAGAQEKK